MVIVEHDEEIMRSADYLIDVGKDAGRLGGNIIYAGSIDNLPKNTESYTVRYLNGEMSIPVPKNRRKWRDYIEVVGASEQNLKPPHI